MADGDGFTSLLVKGAGLRLAAAGIGVWRDNGIYSTDEVGILDRASLPSPDRLITIAAYPIDSGLRGLVDHDVALQFLVRGTADPRVCDDLADAIFTELDGLENVVLNGIPVTSMWRQSYTPLGADDNKRWRRSENYYLMTMRPTAHNNT